MHELRLQVQVTKTILSALLVLKLTVVYTLLKYLVDTLGVSLIASGR